jgi:hypothetical protein
MGGTPIDVSLNLAGVCRICHGIVETNHAENHALQRKIIRREYPEPRGRPKRKSVLAWIQLIWRMPNGSPLPEMPWRAHAEV